MPVTSRSLPVGTAHRFSHIRSVAYIGTAGILAVIMLGFAWTPKARAQSNDHHLYHADYYSKWKQPGTDASCCNGKETKDGDAGQWVIVPYDRILRERNPDIERAHLCFSYGRVLCFVPPNTGT